MLFQVGEGSTCLLMLCFALLEHAHHFFLGCGELRTKVLVFSLEPLHLLGYLVRRVSDDLVHIHDSLYLFGFGAEVQSFLRFLVVRECLAHRAYDGSHGVP